MSGSRASTLLLATSALWLGLTIFAASRVPAPGVVILLLVGAMFLVTLGLWLAAAFYSWAFRRRLGVAAWLSLPVAALLAFLLPWGSWFWAMRVSSHERELTAIAEKYAYLPEGDARAIDPPAQAGPFVFKGVTRFKRGTALSLTSLATGPGQHESGLWLAVDGSSVTSDDADVRVDPDALSGRWYRYDRHRR
ncbi:MAG: hypothetical protein K2Q20_06910 [Phycisphaerales bacterium]|nr:hypothetical protein [Phycisphaerales bacterium]